MMSSSESSRRLPPVRSGTIFGVIIGENEWKRMETFLGERMRRHATCLFIFAVQPSVRPNRLTILLPAHDCTSSNLSDHEW
jgi:hypothetical protein